MNALRYIRKLFDESDIGNTYRNPEKHTDNSLRLLDDEFPDTTPRDETLEMLKLHRQHPLTHPTTTQNQQTSPFLRLPAELRNRIYDILFGHRSIHLKDRTPSKYHQVPRPCVTHIRPVHPDNDVYGPGIENDRTRHPGKQTHTFSLLFVSRQIYEETRYLPFSLNTFRYDERLGRQTWLRSLASRLAVVRKVRLRVEEDWGLNRGLKGGLTKGLAFFPSLGSLELICGYDRYNAGGLDKVLKLAKKTKRDVEALVGSEVILRIYIRKYWTIREYDLFDFDTYFPFKL